MNIYVSVAVLLCTKVEVEPSQGLRLWESLLRIETYCKKGYVTANRDDKAPGSKNSSSSIEATPVAVRSLTNVVLCHTHGT